MTYKIIDPLVQSASSTLVIFVLHLVVPSDWNLFFGMLTGNLRRIVLMTLTMILLMTLLGSFEVMKFQMALVIMTLGMLDGIAVIWMDVTVGCLILTGVIVGLIIYGLVSNSNRKLVPPPKPKAITFRKISPYI